MVGVDAEDVRIAVIIPKGAPGAHNELDPFQTTAMYYQSARVDGNDEDVFVYTPLQAHDLFEILRTTEEVRERKILINGRRRPYDTDLWLPLLWFLDNST